MTQVHIYINTTAGYDTKYLFPGLNAHVSTDQYLTDRDNVGQYLYSRYLQGEIGPNTAGYHYAVELRGAIEQSPGDLQGEVYAMELRDRYDPTNAKLISLIVETDNGKFLSSIHVNSTAALTPNSIVTGLLSDKRTAKLSFDGDTGNDTLRGSFWHDELNGQKGADSMIGGDGNDLYFVDNKGDKVVESSSNGKDTIRTTVDYTLSANVESLTAIGTRDFTLVGHSGNSSLTGAAGDDTIKGEGGNDVIAGLGGQDVLYGGTGKDYFYFVASPTSADTDTVKDFKPVDDSIVLLGSAFGGLTPGLLPKSAFYASTSGKAHDDSDRILYDKDDGKLYFDADGNGDGGRKLIATFTGDPVITYEDFIII